MPLLHIDFTSPQLRSQIYIDIVNWFLLAAVLLMIIIFKTSNNLTHAYGLAVSGYHGNYGSHDPLDPHPPW